MRRSWKAFNPRIAAILALCVVTLGASGDAADPLAAEVARWSEYLAGLKDTDDFTKDIKASGGPSLAIAQEALKDNRRLLALYRIGHAGINFGGLSYVKGLPEGTSTGQEKFEAEWERLGKVLSPSLADPRPDALAEVRPAGVRAMGELTLPQVRGYYDASLEYGRNTMPQFGLLYLGMARSQRDFVALTLRVSRPEAKKAPPLRSLAPEIEILQGELLAAYKPPASIDRHSEFIGASSTLNDARELDALGLRYGAMMRYLQAALRLAPLRGPKPAVDPASVPEKLAQLEKQLAASDVDHSIARYFLEAAAAEKTANPAPPNPIAPVVATELIPRYLAALQPGKPQPAKPAADLTVTLIRWPYT